MTQVIEEYVGPKGDADKFTTRWWNQPKEEMFKHVFATVRMLEARQNYRTLENIKNARLYSDLEILGIYAGLYMPGTRDQIMPNRLSLNVIASCIDTVTSKIAKSKPRPMFLTEDGDFRLQRKAQNLTKFLDGKFDAMGLYETKQDTFRDSGVWGTGATKHYIDWQKKEVCSERVIIQELITDDAESIYGTPRTLYQTRLVSKDVLKEMFPKAAGFIEDAANDLKGSYTNTSVRDLVKVVEAWHLRSGPNAKDGCHVMVIDNKTLSTEAWNFDWFPFTFERWKKNLIGFYGIGLARELTGIQVEINKILRNIQQSMHLFAVPRVFVENSSQVNLAAINNDIGAIVKYSGVSLPQFHTPQAMSPDVYQHLWNLVSKAYEISGVSQLSASSAKPEGLDSGKALREFQDIESDRFQIVGQRRELSFLEDAKITIELQKALAKECPDAQVKVSDQGSMKIIKFKDVDLKEEQYLMRVFPASILPTQPAAKMQTIVEYTQSGFLDKDTAMDLMDFPDLQAATSRLISQRRLVFKILDEMVEKNEYQAPEPYFKNLQWVQEYAQMYYMDAKLKGVPEENLELIRTFISDCATMNGIAAQGMAQAQMAMQGGPAAGAAPDATIAQPQEQPTSDLLPVAS